MKRPCDWFIRVIQFAASTTERTADWVCGGKAGSGSKRLNGAVYATGAARRNRPSAGNRWRDRHPRRHWLGRDYGSRLKRRRLSQRCRGLRDRRHGRNQQEEDHAHKKTTQMHLGPPGPAREEVDL